MLPVLEETKVRLEKMSQHIQLEGGNSTMKDAGDLVGELLQVTEARIQKVWRCCEILCSRYARDRDTPLATRREELQARMRRLRDIIDGSMPDMGLLRDATLEPARPRSNSTKDPGMDREDQENNTASERRMGNLKASTFTQDASKVLRKWFFDHFSHPYPEKEEKERLCNETGLTAKQLNDWFSNWRKRVWNRGMTNAPKADLKTLQAAMGGP